MDDVDMGDDDDSAGASAATGKAFAAAAIGGAGDALVAAAGGAGVAAAGDAAGTGTGALKGMARALDRMGIVPASPLWVHYFTAESALAEALAARYATLLQQYMGVGPGMRVPGAASPAVGPDAAAGGGASGSKKGSGTTSGGPTKLPGKAGAGGDDSDDEEGGGGLGRAPRAPPQKRFTAGDMLTWPAGAAGDAGAASAGSGAGSSSGTAAASPPVSVASTDGTVSKHTAELDVTAPTRDSSVFATMDLSAFQVHAMEGDFNPASLEVCVPGVQPVLQAIHACDYRMARLVARGIIV